MRAVILLVTVLSIGVWAQDTIEDLIKTVFQTDQNPYEASLPPTGGEVTLEGIIKKVFKTDQDYNSLNQTRLPLTGGEGKFCPNGQECVKAYLCSNGHTNIDGATLINVRFDNDEPNECPFSETCCSVDSIVTEPIIRTTHTATRCGYRNIDGVGFKIEGATNEAEFGEFPWMLAILRSSSDSNRNIYQCGGSLIHPKVVLTGAHCVDGKSANELKVRAGEWDTNSKTELYPNQDRQVTAYVLHEKYNKSNLYNDVALLILDSPFEMAPNVNTLCLPPPGFNFDFSRCYATGWGKDRFPNGNYHNILKKVDLSAVPNFLCQDNLRKTRLGRHFQLHWSFMCAGGESGKDTCQGDGGSPLVCPIDGASNRYYQAGIVAWGIGCGQQDVPGVYVNVAQHRPWIDEQFSIRGINSSHYTA